jgi:hypothetical protein
MGMLTDQVDPSPAVDARRVGLPNDLADEVHLAILQNHPRSSIIAGERPDHLIQTGVAT